MPYKSKAQAAYLHIHAKELGIKTKEWDEATKREGKKLPEHVSDRKK